MAIRNVIVHVVKRDVDGEPLTTQLRDKVNATTGLAKKLTDDLIELFSTATMNVGEFGLDGDTKAKPTFELKLEKYYGTSTTCIDFVALTQELANHYKFILALKSLKTVKGGYLVFYEFTKQGDIWLAMAILRKSVGVDIADNLDVIASQTLDLERLHLGASINLTKWQKGFDSRYIKFKVGLAKEVRDYFEDFIGCQRDKHAAVVETQSLREAIREFAIADLNYTKEVALQRAEEAYNYILEKEKNGEQILVSHIASKIFPEHRDAFLKKAMDTHNIAEELVIDKGELRKFKRFSGRSEGISLSFPREMLQKEVEYTGDGTLIFKKIPYDLKKEIESEIESLNRINNT